MIASVRLLRPGIGTVHLFQDGFVGAEKWFRGEPGNKPTLATTPSSPSVIRVGGRLHSRTAGLRWLAACRKRVCGITSRSVDQLRAGGRPVERLFPPAIGHQAGWTRLRVRRGKRK